MSISGFAAAALAVFLGISPVNGQQTGEHQHSQEGPPESVHFPVSCKEDLQSDFNHAVANLHSFGYEEARRGFLSIAERDPGCGMAWWGVAMTYFHQLWDQPTPDELESGLRSAQKAGALRAGTRREQGYISAIGTFYKNHGSLDHRSRTLAYKDAMKKLAAGYPDDREASIFYALSLLASQSPQDTTFNTQKKAADILNRLLPDYPAHPGIVHYTIHAFDYPGLAELALPAARTYANIAPDSPHALHMPSHIFTRLGLWEESIASNLEVARVARQQVARTHPGSFAFENLHANDYLVYAYLQLGRDREAANIVREAARAKRFDDPNFAAGYALASTPARYALERRDWKAAAALELPGADIPLENFPYAFANIHYARAIGSARTEDASQVRAAVAELRKLRDYLRSMPPRGPYNWAGRLEAMHLAATGWLAYSEQRKEEAVRLLSEAADLEERVGKHPVTPGPVLPAREQLGDLLLELGHWDEALIAYESVLSGSPNRLNALAGAGRAAEMTKNFAKAEANYKKMLALCRPSGCQRPSATWATGFLDSQ